MFFVIAYLGCVELGARSIAQSRLNAKLNLWIRDKDTSHYATTVPKMLHSVLIKPLRRELLKLLDN